MPDSRILELETQLTSLRDELREAHEALEAIRAGVVDALVMASKEGQDRVFALEGSDYAYRALVEQMHEGAATLNASGHILYANRSLAKLFEHPLETVIGAEITRFFAPPDDERIRSLCADCLASGLEGEMELLMKGADGTQVPIALSFKAFDAYGTRILSLTVANLTEHKARARAEAAQQNEERLRQSYKLESLGLMAGGIAHDFNNQFQAILGNLEIMKLEVQPRSRAANALVRALDVLAKSTALSHQMLEYTGKAPLRMEVLHLNRFLEQHRNAFTDRMPSQVQLEFDLADHLPLISADPQRLLQCIEMLFINALEAHGAGGGMIRIRTRFHEFATKEGLSEGWVECPPVGPIVFLSLEDSGSGIPPAHLSQIFDPFFTTKEVGRGLGLATTLGILRGHKGGIQVESTEGLGTIFRLAFLAHTELPISVGPAPKVTREHRQTILLVDDDDDMRSTLVDVLHEVLGHPILEARDGIQATEVFKLHEAEIGLVLMDMVMPRLNGVEAFECLKKIQPGVRGILMSGFSEKEGNLLAVEHGFQAFIRKPFTINELKGAIQSSLGRAAGSAP